MHRNMCRRSRSSWRVGVIAAVQFTAVIAIVLWPAGGWAQSGISAEFKPTIAQKVDARSSPANVTGADESALPGMGYIQIGTISAWQPGDKADPEVTKQLESSILQKAAAAGGDLVRFTQSGKVETKKIPKGKPRGGGGCAQYSRVPDGRGGMMQSTNCISSNHYIQDTYEEHYIVSKGTVWRNARNDPKLANILAHAQEVARYSADLTRKPEEATEEATRKVKAAAIAAFPMMKTWLSNLGTPEVERYYKGSSYYRFNSEGIVLAFNTEDKINGIFFYDQYQGDLPFGLSFQNTRKEVESILGPPDNSGGGGSMNYYTYYKSRGLGITYNTKRSNDLNARISEVSISPVP